MEYSNLRDEIAAIRQKLNPSENSKYSTVRDELGALRRVIDPGSGGGGAGLESITYAELKAKRDNGELTPGGQYRITDYVCTTTQEETRAVSHPFDIIVVADDENTLNENARACLHEGDNYYSAEGRYAKLEAWELKYCIDNDTSNFPWVDATNGKGVIYYMKDDRDNECSYDFKQIQFKRYKITECEAAPSLVGKYTALEHGNAITAVDDDNPVWCYTFSVYDQNSETVEMFDGSIYPMSYDLEESAFVFGNSLPTYGENETGLGHSLGGNVFVFGFGDGCNYNTFGDGCAYNTFGNNCYYNTFGDGCAYNTFGGNCNSNTFVGGCGYNTFGDGCAYNTFGNDCYSNTFGDGCAYNTFGNNCQYVDFAAGSHMDNVQYYHILDGVQGADSSHATIPATEGNNHVTYIGKNSQGNLVTWVPADLQ